MARKARRHASSLWLFLPEGHSGQRGKLPFQQ